MEVSQQAEWGLFRGTGKEVQNEIILPDPPKWRSRKFKSTPPELDWKEDPDESLATRGRNYKTDKNQRDIVNAALYLRRPLLITGAPGSGKSSLAYAVAYELRLGPVLVWPITTRSTLQEGLYRYDAIARLQDANLPPERQPVNQDIGKYIRLGPVGTALLPWKRPRVLLIDEIDKSDIDLPNDLLNIFEEAEFDIPELVRIADQDSLVKVLRYDSRDNSDTAAIEKGRVKAYEFPFVVLTSNGEREFPPAFLRRCLRLEMPTLNREKLSEIVKAQISFDEKKWEEIEKQINEFVKRRDEGNEILATDQLLNAIYLTTQGVNRVTMNELLEQVTRKLNS